MGIGRLDKKGNKTQKGIRPFHVTGGNPLSVTAWMMELKAKGEREGKKGKEEKGR